MNINTVFPNGYMELTLSVMNEDYLKYANAWDKIEQAIEKKKPIPYKHFQTVIDCWSRKPEIEELEQNKEYDKLNSQLPQKIDTAIKRFSQNKSYLFTGKYTVKGFVPPALPGITNIQEEHIVDYNLDKLLTVCAKEYYRYGKGSKTKEDSILWFYDRMSIEILNYMQQHQKQLTKYVKTVLAAYMTHNFTQWQLIDPSKKNSYTNEDLYQAAKNAFRRRKEKAEFNQLKSVLLGYNY